MDLSQYDPKDLALSDMPDEEARRRYWLINECFEAGVRLWLHPDKGEVLLPCNDLFFWAVSDLEELPPEYWPRFVQDMGEMVDDREANWYSIGWCMRARNLRCQKPYLKYMDEHAHNCFHRCFGFKIEDLPHYGKLQGWPADDKLIATEATHQFEAAILDREVRSQ